MLDPRKVLDVLEAVEWGDAQLHRRPECRSCLAQRGEWSSPAEPEPQHAPYCRLRALMSECRAEISKNFNIPCPD